MDILNVDQAILAMIARERKGGSSKKSDIYVPYLNQAMRDGLARNLFSADQLKEATLWVKTFAFDNPDAILEAGEAQAGNNRARFNDSAPHKSKVAALPTWKDVVGSLKALLVQANAPIGTLTAGTWVRTSIVVQLMSAVYEEITKDFQSKHGRYIQNKMFISSLTSEQLKTIVAAKVAPFLTAMGVWKEKKWLVRAAVGEPLGNTGLTTLVEHWKPTEEFITLMKAMDKPLDDKVYKDGIILTNPKLLVVTTNIFDVRQGLQTSDARQYKREAKGIAVQELVRSWMASMMKTADIHYKGKEPINGKKAAKNGACQAYFKALAIIKATHRACVAPFVTKGGADTAYEVSFDFDT